MKILRTRWVQLTLVLLTALIWVLVFTLPARSFQGYGPDNPSPDALTSIAWETAWSIEQTQTLAEALKRPIPTPNPHATYVPTIQRTATPFSPYATRVTEAITIFNPAPNIPNTIDVTRSQWLRDNGDGTKTVIFVGASARRPYGRDIQGTLAVDHRTTPTEQNPLGKTLSSTTIRLPEGTGPVRIADTDGIRLFLEAETGETFTFNTESMTLEP